nr:acyltransferase family protein [Enterococcus thailandicus]
MKRNYSIDLIKTMAAFFVVAVHFLLNSGFYDQTIQTNRTLFWMMTRQVTITAVPLFLLCTGFLMNRKKLSVSCFVLVCQHFFSWLAENGCDG